jgi:hypothetical protein
MKAEPGFEAMAELAAGKRRSLAAGWLRMGLG